MFTGQRISLSAVANNSREIEGEIEILRDFSFAYVGKIPSVLPDRLVAVSAPRHLAELAAAKGVAGALTTPELAEKIPLELGVAVSPAPYALAMDIHEYIAFLPNFQWVNFASEIDPSVQVHSSAAIAANNVKVGPECVIGPNAVICERVVMGRGCSVGPGSVVGFDAYDLKAGSTPQRLLRQSGGVKLEDFVSLGANVTIDRASFGGFTILEDAVCVDNLSYIAHDCHIYRNTRIASSVSINGRTVVGENCYIGPNSVISNGLSFGPNCTIDLGSVVTQSLNGNSRVAGNFAIDHDKLIKFIKSIR